jgi:ketosteroid isomerase-like protein
VSTRGFEMSWMDGYFAAWGGTDVEAVTAYVDEDVDFEDTTMGERYQGKAQFTRFVKGCFKIVPDMRYEIIDSEELGDSYWVEWLMQPQGVRGASVGRTKDGKIVYNRDYWNGAKFQPHD